MTNVSGGLGRFVVLARTNWIEVPPRVDYALTLLGRGLAEAIVPLCASGTDYAAEIVGIFAERDALPREALKPQQPSP